jgi:glutamate-1-semialdehyde aminotransferase
MDEVVTGFRYALGGASELYGIEPDICCYGKALGNGIAISCIVGRRELMQWFNRKDPVFVSSTNFGDAVGLAAADAFLDIWNEKTLARIWDTGKKLQDGLNAIGLNVVGNPPRSLLQFSDSEKASGKALRAYFVAGMRDRGVLMNRPNFPNLAHTDAEVQQALAAAKEVRDEMHKVDVGKAMKGKLPWVLFERR